MQRYAQLSDNVVQNVIESDFDPDGINGEWIACGDAGPGWLYNAQTREFSRPLAPTGSMWQWYIDIGPFYDRFGATKMQVLTSSDSGIKAILADLNIRKWVDLKRADVAQALQYVGSVIPAVTTQLQDSILNTPVSDIENLALRKLYFNA